MEAGGASAPLLGLAAWRQACCRAAPPSDSREPTLFKKRRRIQAGIFASVWREVLVLALRAFRLPAGGVGLSGASPFRLRSREPCFKVLPPWPRFPPAGGRRAWGSRGAWEL